MENQEQTVEQQKQKNPKRVEAGKKGAEARRLKKEAKLREEAAKPVEDNPEPSVHPVLKVTKEQPLLSEQTTSKNYQNYIPICAIVLIIGFYFMNKPKEGSPEVQEPKVDPWHMK